MTAGQIQQTSQQERGPTYQFGIRALMITVAAAATIFAVIKVAGLLWSIPLVIALGLFFRPTRKTSGTLLALFAGCRTLMTGCPVPLWHVERLNNPVEVQRVTDDAIMLVDGRAISLAYINKIPKDDPVFLAAMKRGVEVDDYGRVFGLLTFRPWCGHDPYVSFRNRVNLSELAAVLCPQGLDKDRLPDWVVRDITENTIQWAGSDPNRLSTYLEIDLSRARRRFQSVEQQLSGATTNELDE